MQLDGITIHSHEAFNESLAAHASCAVSIRNHRHGLEARMP